MADEPENENEQPADGVQVTGALKVELFDEDGELVESREVENLVTTVGRNAIVDQLLAAPAVGKPTHMAVGTDSTAAALGDTALGGELARVAFTTKSRSANVLTYVGDFAAGTGTGALAEAGILNASGAGDLYQRTTFAVINKAAGFSLKITWTLTIG